MRLLLLLPVAVAICLSLADTVRGKVCTQSVSNTVQETEYYNTACGWWNWGRCQRSRVVYKTVYSTVEKCCIGSFGRPESGCKGECPHVALQTSSACPNNGMCRDYTCVKTGFDVAGPSSEALTFNENDNDARLLWKANATCFVQDKCDCTTEQFTTSGTCTCSAAVPCTQCTVQSTNGIAQVKNGVEIWRKECSNPDCKVCAPYAGCLDYSTKYTLKVQCTATGYDDNGLVSKTISLKVDKAPEPDISISVGGSGGNSSTLDIVTDAKVGDTVLIIDPIEIPDSEKDPKFELKGPKSTTTGEDLFSYNATTGAVTVNADLSSEMPDNYTLQLCVTLRRGTTCADFTISILQTTTTSTTTTTTSPEPEEELACFAAPEWREVPGFDGWCQMICGNLLEDCPYLHTHCECIDVLSERINCTYVGKKAELLEEGFLRSLNAWCYLNCNYGENYSYCPPEYCTCQ